MEGSNGYHFERLDRVGGFHCDAAFNSGVHRLTALRATWDAGARVWIADTGETLDAAMLIECIAEQFQAAGVEVDDVLSRRISEIVRRALTWPAMRRLH